MQSIILSKTDRPKYYGLMTALNFCGIHTVFPHEQFERTTYDLIFADKTCMNIALNLQANTGGIIVCDEYMGEVKHVVYKLDYALDTLHRGKEIDFLKCDVAYAGGWNDNTSEIIPCITDMNQKFSTKIYGSPQLSSIEGYFWDFPTCDIAENAKISLILPSSRPEHYWEALASERPTIMDTEALDIEVNIDEVLENYSHHQEVAVVDKREMFNTNTYFHQIINVLNIVQAKYQDPIMQPIIESVNYKYDENRLYSRQSGAVAT